MAEHMPVSLGFKSGSTSVHTKRTMMLDDLALALERVPQGGTPADYFGVILNDNVLGKATRSTREASAKILTALYGFDPTFVVFRILRRYWEVDAASRPMIAFLAASARDSMLREMTPFVLGIGIGKRLRQPLLPRSWFPFILGDSKTQRRTRLPGDWHQVGLKPDS